MLKFVEAKPVMAERLRIAINAFNAGLRNTLCPEEMLVALGVRGFLLSGHQWGRGFIT
jgi:hypothetical protein